MTNLLQTFQVSLAYKAVALQLMLGDANSCAERLNLAMPRPIEASHLVEHYVGTAKFGVNGSLRTTNFAFTYWEGRLHTITRMDVLHGPGPLREEFDRLAVQPSLIDSNGACRLATRWLASASVDVQSLQKKYPAQVSQRWYYADRYGLEETPPSSAARKYLPIYDIKWSNTTRPEYEVGAIKVAVLGSSKTLVDLEIGDFSFSLGAPLVVTNAAASSSTPSTVAAPPTVRNSNTATDIWRRPRWAPPADLPQAEWAAWVEKFFGSETVHTLKSPRRVNAYLIKTDDPLKVRKTVEEYRVKKGPVLVADHVVRQLTEVVLNLRSYDWRIQPFAADYIVRVQYQGETNAVDAAFAFNEDALLIYTGDRRTPELYFRPARNEIVTIVENIFPSERAIRRFGKKDGSKK